MNEDNNFRVMIFGFRIDVWNSYSEHMTSNALKVVSDKQLVGIMAPVVVVYDGSSKASGVKLYLDGNLVGNKVEQDSLKDSIVTKIPFKLGSRSKSSYFKELDELRIYDRALNQDEIKNIGGANKKPPGSR